MLSRRSLIMLLRTKVERAAMDLTHRDRPIISRNSLKLSALSLRRVSSPVLFSASPNNRQSMFPNKWMRNWISLMDTKKDRSRHS